MYTIGELGKIFKISRSTLLYYDSIDLLKPTDRSDNNYRLYSEEDKERLEKICLYRQIGLPLKEILQILNNTDTGTFVLHNHLGKLNKKINKIRYQQRIIVKMIKDKKLLKEMAVTEKVNWFDILIKIGLKEVEADNLHIEFERLFPEKHQYFLEALGFSEGDIIKIREYYNLSSKK